MVVGFDSRTAPVDAVSFVTWVELLDGESIRLVDAEYDGGGDGTGEGSGGGFYNSALSILWTNDTGVAILPGTVIVISDTFSPSANIGTATGRFGLTINGEQFFLMQGDLVAGEAGYYLNGEVLFGVDYEGSTVNPAWGESGESALPSVLNVANGNLNFGDVEAREYLGARSGVALASYPSEIMTVANWSVPTASGVLPTESFVDLVIPPEDLPDELGGVSSGEVFYTRRMNGELPIIDEAWMIAQGATAAESDNINGPSCIRIPSWVAPGDRADPSAVYYLYFADHNGDFIRMAWAVNLEGPWTGFRMDAALPLEDRGVLSLGSDGEITPGNGIVVDGHIASPQVFVDDVNQKFVMYYHGPSEHNGNDKGQSTVVATSADGLNFNLPADGGQADHGTKPVILGESYFRVFQQDGRFYAFSNTGDLWKAPVDPFLPPAGYDYSKDYWDRGPNPFVDGVRAQGWPLIRPRHFGVLKRGNILYTILSYKEDRPEQLKMATFDFDELPEGYNSWAPRFPEQELLSAQSGWEGGQFPPRASQSGAQAGGVNQLRDPGVFVDSDGRTYLFYCGQGETAIGLGQLVSAPQVTGESEVVRGEDETFTIGLDLDVTSGMRRISHSAPVEVDYDAEEAVLPMSYAGSGGYSVLQNSTVYSGARSFHLAHVASGASETLTFSDRYYARPGAQLVYRSRLGSATEGQVAEVQASFDGVLWQTLQIKIGGAAETSFQEVTVDLEGLVGRTFELRFRYSHDVLRDAIFVSGVGAGQGWFLDEVVGTNLESVQVLDEASFTGGSFTLDDITSFLNPFLADGTGEEDRFLLSVDGVHSSAATGYGKPLVIRVRTSYEQFQLVNFSEAEQVDSLISGEGADPDRDGLSNLEEHVFGSDPHVANSGLMSLGGSLVGAVVEPFLSFPWNSDSDFTYQLQMSTDLLSFSDIPSTEIVTGMGLQQVALEPAPSVPVPGDRAFFRLKISAQ